MDAKDEITSYVTEKVTYISDWMTWLSDEDRDTYNQRIILAADEVDFAINSASSVDEINWIVNGTKADIDAIVTEVERFNEINETSIKSDAMITIYSFTDDVKNFIDCAVWLDSDQKNDLYTQLNATYNDAINLVDNATSKHSIEDMLLSITYEISSLNEKAIEAEDEAEINCRAGVLAELDACAESALSDIEKLTWIDESFKDDYKSRILDAFNEATDIIANAQSRSAVEDALESHKQFIGETVDDACFENGMHEDLRKTSAIEDISFTKEEAQTTVDSLTWLSDEKKNEYQAAIDGMFAAASNCIDIASSQADIDQARNDAVRDILVKRSEAVAEDARVKSEYKQSAYNEIDFWFNNAAGTIENMAHLDEKAVGEYLALLAAPANTANGTIDVAESRSEVDDAVTTAKSEFTVIVLTAQNDKDE